MSVIQNSDLANKQTSKKTCSLVSTNFTLPTLSGTYLFNFTLQQFLFRHAKNYS